MPPEVSRRTLVRLTVALPGAALLSLTGCDQASEPPAPDPDRIALQGALAVELALHATVAGLSSAAAEVVPDAADVVSAHVQTLRTALGSPTGSPSPTSSPSPGTSLVDVLTAADDAAVAHTRAIRTASVSISPLLASLAASDAALAAALRRVR